MKGLNTRTLGYFSFGVAMMCLLVQAWSEGISGWLNLALACFAMLAVVLIASASTPGFQKQNSWLVRCILVGLSIPPVVVLLSQWHVSGFSISAGVAALLGPSLAIVSFVWYRRTHGVDTDSEF